MEKLGVLSLIMLENPLVNRKVLYPLLENKTGVYVFISELPDLNKWTLFLGKEKSLYPKLKTPDLETANTIKIGNKDFIVLYVGHSFIPRVRISHYFKPSVLSSQDLRIYRYLYYNPHTVHGQIKVYLLKENATLLDLTMLEQNLILSLNPLCNVEKKVLNNSSKTRKDFLLRGESVYVYSKMKDLLYVFSSKQTTIETLKIHHKTLNSCLNHSVLYLNTVYFEKNFREDAKFKNFSLKRIKHLIENARDHYLIPKPYIKKITAINIAHPEQTKDFETIISCSTCLNISKTAIKSRLKGKTSRLYKNQWMFKYKE